MTPAQAKALDKLILQDRHDDLKAELDAAKRAHLACQVARKQQRAELAESQRMAAQLHEIRAELLAELEAEKLDSHGLMERCKALEAEVQALKRQIAEIHSEMCENGHTEHADCNSGCSCVGQGESRMEKLDAEIEQWIDKAGELSTRVEALEAERDALKAQLDTGLDYERHSSCGHVWTMRHTACPVCFAALRAEVAAAREDVINVRAASQAMEEALAIERADRIRVIHARVLDEEVNAAERHSLRAELAASNRLVEDLAEQCKCHRLAGVSTRSPHGTTVSGLPSDASAAQRQTTPALNRYTPGED